MCMMSRPKIPPPPPPPPAPPVPVMVEPPKLDTAPATAARKRRRNPLQIDTPSQATGGSTAGLNIPV